MNKKLEVTIRKFREKLRDKLKLTSEYSIYRALRRLLLSFDTKSCDNCYSDDSYDCRYCLRNKYSDEKPNNEDQWQGEINNEY